MGGQGGEKTGGEFEGKEVGQMEAHWAQGQKQGAAPPAGRTPLQRGQQLPCSVTWSGQDRGGHRSRTQLTWPACRGCWVSDLLPGLDALEAVCPASTPAPLPPPSNT